MCSDWAKVTSTGFALTTPRVKLDIVENNFYLATLGLDTSQSRQHTLGTHFFRGRLSIGCAQLLLRRHPDEDLLLSWSPPGPLGRTVFHGVAADDMISNMMMTGGDEDDWFCGCRRALNSGSVSHDVDTFDSWEHYTGLGVRGR